MSNNICQDCGMVVRTPTEYHPYAACLMFKACHDGDTVRANLEAVRSDARSTQATPDAAEAAQEDRSIVATYEKLHKGKLGAHWLWCVIEQIAAGVTEAEAMREYGYCEPRGAAEAGKDAIPEGWKLVPLKPTQVMQDAWDGAPGFDDCDREFANAYRLMVAAALPPSGSGEKTS